MGMFNSDTTRKFKLNRKPTAYYGCINHHKWAIAADIEHELVEYLLSGRFPDDWKERGINTLAIRIGKAESEKRIQEIRDMIARMDFRWDKGFITDTDEYMIQRKVLADELEALEPMQVDIYAQAEDMINHFPKYWAACKTLEEQRDLIRSIVEAVYVLDKHIHSIVLKPGMFVSFY